MSGKLVVFTGGTGKAGRHAVPHLVAHGYSILNVDLKPLDMPGVPTLIADLTDSGQAFNALTTHHDFAGFESGRPPRPPGGPCPQDGAGTHTVPFGVSRGLPPSETGI